MSLLQLIAEDSWLIRLLGNHIGYVPIAIPIAALFVISKKSAYSRCKYCLYY